MLPEQLAGICINSASPRGSHGQDLSYPVVGDEHGRCIGGHLDNVLHDPDDLSGLLVESNHVALRAARATDQIVAVNQNGLGIAKRRDLAIKLLWEVQCPHLLAVLRV